jgi:parvulin-like peptidyl-prolyl isomerase
MTRTSRTAAVAALSLAVVVTASAQHELDQVAVFVNGEPIYNWEVSFLFAQIKNTPEMQAGQLKGRAALEAVLGRAIDNRLLEQEAVRLGFEPNSDRVREKLAKKAEEAGGRGKLEVHLIRSRVTYEQLRATVIQADLIQTLVETQIESTIEITDDEAKRFYEENPELFVPPRKVRSRHILFTVDDGASEEQRRSARARAEAARERALAGEDFAELAAELSEGPNAERGGDLGFTARGSMVEAFDDAVWALSVGEISEVVESDLGYHVIKVESFDIPPATSLDDARPVIEKLLFQNRTGERLAALLVTLRENAEIRFPESIDTMADVLSGGNDGN